MKKSAMALTFAAIAVAGSAFALNTCSSVGSPALYGSPVYEDYYSEDGTAIHTLYGSPDSIDMENYGDDGQNGLENQLDNTESPEVSSAGPSD